LENLKVYAEDDIRHFIRIRKGEQKIGETILLTTDFLNAAEAIEKFSGKYVVLGIPEDIGPRANYGRGGANTAFPDFLSYFLNMQENRFLVGNQLLLLGEVKVDDLMKRSLKKPENINMLRDLVAELDERVSTVIARIVAAGKIPVVIGGGHNNAYPVIKGSFLALGETPLAVVNIDPHADIRPLEGRHSGNGFSHAVANGYLDRYFAIGLHENYNNDYTWDTLDADKDLFGYITYEDILDKDLKTKAVTDTALKFTRKMPMGLEIDLDCMQYTECSAKTPVGFRPDKVRKMIRRLCSQKNIVYINISEGITNPDTQTGKLIAYLVTEFIRAVDRP
jgi:formiminoglutamase